MEHAVGNGRRSRERREKWESQSDSVVELERDVPKLSSDPRLAAANRVWKEVLVRLLV